MLGLTSLGRAGSAEVDGLFRIDLMGRTLIGLAIYVPLAWGVSYVPIRSPSLRRPSGGRPSGSGHQITHPAAVGSPADLRCGSYSPKPASGITSACCGPLAADVRAIRVVRVGRWCVTKRCGSPLSADLWRRPCRWTRPTFRTSHLGRPYGTNRRCGPYITSGRRYVLNPATVPASPALTCPYVVPPRGRCPSGIVWYSSTSWT